MLTRSQKNAWREEILESFNKANAVFLARYSQMTVEDLTNLRRELRKTEADFQVVKNKVAVKAIEGRKEAVISDFFTGQTGVVFAYGDVAAVAKVITEFAKKNDKLVLTGGFMESAKVQVSDIQVLASLPSREVLLSKIIGSLIAPHKGLMGIMQAVPSALVRALDQIREQKAQVG